ncbi:MAG: DUF1538 domain-containing protein [Methylomonas sp.]|nr:DUF1538 domain-containing protein [Methylomonas sp.]PPD19514.1 MAG: hypothetical protein CTY23_11605 [Methylomonas sp.]PPD24796.1 MAG: hypothetical protein CTY22_10590 [Methylomonas sp.]PPD33495.1 MAG: hypothetical protein CTY21_10570 [Methylomonas sp.]PPD53808.1 MAG: hypothetical protein CTY11_05245 [Methylomonas sp.]
MNGLAHFVNTLIETLSDVTPIVAIILGFQVLVLRYPLPHPGRTVLGFCNVLIGIVFFLEGLKLALFPLGELMAKQMTTVDFLGLANPLQSPSWQDYYWVYLFAACIGFATALAEPSLLAVATKAEEISGGTISALGLRIAVAIGVAFGLTLGTFRIVTGIPMYYLIIGCYITVIVLTLSAPKIIIGLAYDSGGVTTSTVTVPLVTALGLGLAANVPGRDPLVDGFGLIAFACLFPIMTVLTYARLAVWLAQKRNSNSSSS